MLRLQFLLGCLGLLLACSARGEEQERAFFERRIQPILEKRCYECHSHRASEVQGGLVLDSRSGWLKGGDAGPAIVPGKPDESLLIKAVRRFNKDQAMPPEERLPDEETALLVEWVRRGAVDPRQSPDTESGSSWTEKLAERRKAWCWQPVARPPLPEVGGAAQGAIDRFLVNKMQREGLELASPVDRWTLARRLAYVLTGLPPDPREVEAFAADENPEAYERLVDCWLASPDLGEHWARHWMDLVKYSDTHGSEHDPLIPHAWRYRDYLVRAFNSDVPYDRFVREHLAGDTLPPRWNVALGLNESPLGTGFFRFVEFYPTPIDVKNEEVQVLDSQIDVFGKTFQGLTLACARCHDHKFDAISAQDFAALYGIFASTRTTMLRLDDPAKRHEFDPQLVAIKRELRGTLTSLWREQLEHWPQAAIAAREKLREPLPSAQPPDAKEKAKDPAPPPFAPGARSLEAEIYRWQTALKAADDKPADALHLLAKLAKADEKQTAELLMAAKARAERPAALDPRFRLFADFTGEPGTSAEPPAGWFAADNFQSPSPSGDFAVQPAGNSVLTAIYPRGRYSHLLSNKHGGTLRSPNFDLTMKHVSVLAAGTFEGRVRLVIENFPSDQLLFANVMPKFNEPRLQWITLPIREVWAGRRAYLEISPRDEMPYPGKMPDATKLNTDGRSGVGIRSVVFHDQPGTPELEPPLPSALWQSATDWPTFVAQLKAAVTAALDAWTADRASDVDARLLDALLRSGVLLNEAPIEHELARQLARYRELEARIPVPPRAPGVADDVGFDERYFPRGNHKKPGASVPRRYLEVLGSRAGTGGYRGSGRKELAEAVVDPRNPLTARVMVNRIWQHVFGVGLVPTVDNFGKLGEPPSHPELLDWLAADFVESGWAVKRLLRQMLTSRAFQASSAASIAARERDPANRWLSHTHVRRLEAEPLRDSLLAVAGRLDRRQGGLGVPLPLPAAYKDFENPLAGPPDGLGRRSIYLEARRNYPQLFLAAFDQPRPVLTVGRRNVTNVPAQSLALLNDTFVAQQAAHLAQRFAGLSTPESRIQAMSLAVFARPATEAELARSVEFLKLQAQTLSLPDDAWQTQASVWNDLAHALLNQKEFSYLR